MRLSTFGGVTLDGIALRSLPARRLLGYCVAAPNPSSDRAEIASKLWPDAAKPRDNLRNAVSDMNSIVSAAGKSVNAIFSVATRDTLVFQSHVHDIDVERFRTLVADAALDSARSAIILYRGEFLPGVVDDWVETMRRRCQDDYCAALSRAANDLTSSEPREALRLARLWEDTAPLSQEPYRVQMELLAALNETPEALMVYHRLAERLDDELAISPDRNTVKLYEQLLGATSPGAAGGPDIGRTPTRHAGLQAYVYRLLDEYENYARYASNRTLRIEPRLRSDLCAQHLPVPAAEFNRSQPLEDVDVVISRAIERGNSTACVLLGDYGAGKSSALWTLAVGLGRAFVESPETARYPVLLSLREVGNIRHGWDTIRTLLQRQDLGDSALAALRELVERGRVVFCLDGLDELGRGLTHQQMLLSWRRIQEDLVVGGSYVVVSCRSSFFRGSRQLVDGIVPRDETLVETIVSERLDAPLLLELRPWSAERIQQRLEVGWGSNWRHYWNALRHVHPRLADLCTRPGFLQMTIDTRQLLEVATDVHLVDLIAAHAELWYQHNEARSYLGREAKEQLIEEVAFRLWKSSHDVINSAELRDIIKGLTDEPLDAATIRASEDDIAVCTQLEWASDGYRFVSDLHLAHAIAMALDRRCRSNDFADFGAARLGPEATTFLAQLTQRDGILPPAQLLDLMCTKTDQAGPFGGGNAASILVARGEVLSDLDLQGASLRGAYLSGARLTGAVLQGADLSDAVLDGAALDEADLTDANVTRAAFGEGGRIGIIRLDPTGGYFAIGDHFGSISLWETDGRRRLAVLDGHYDDVWALAWNPSNITLLATGGLDRTVRFWEREGQGLVERSELGILEHGDWVLGVSWSPTGDRLAASCADGLVRVWRPGCDCDPLIQDLDGDVHGVAWHPEEDLLAVATGTASVAIWDLQSHKIRFLDVAGSVATWSVAWSRDGKYLASTSDDGSVRVWSRSGFRPTTDHVGLHDGPALGCAWSPNGELLATSGEDHTIRVWKTPVLTQHAELQGHRANTWNLTWHSSDRLLLSASDDATVRYWNPTVSGSPEHTIRQPPRCHGTIITGVRGLTNSTRDRLIAAGARA